MKTTATENRRKWVAATFVSRLRRFKRAKPPFAPLALLGPWAPPQGLAWCRLRRVAATFRSRGLLLAGPAATLLLLLLLLLLPLLSFAAFSHKYVGTTSGTFLKLGVDARAVAMGQAYSAVAEDSSAVYWNPAGLAALTDRHASLSHTAFFEGVFFDFISYAQPVEMILGKRGKRFHTGRMLGTMGAAVLYLNSGTFREIDNSGKETGRKFTPYDLAAYLAWGSSWGILDFGLAAKFVRSEIHSRAQTYALDPGIRLRLLPWGVPWTISAGAQNLIGKLKFVKEAIPLPVNLRVGQCIIPHKDWIVSADVNFPRDNRPYFGVGAEYIYDLDLDWTMFLRGGYSSFHAKADLGAKGVSLGVGIAFRLLSLDYAWVPLGDLGPTHRISFNVRF